jgi:hypothetical protein
MTYFGVAMKLTQRKIELLKCPDGPLDGEQTGLGVRITASGGRTYLAQYTYADTNRMSQTVKIA